MLDLSSIVDLLTLIAVISGVFFGAAEIRRASQARKDAATIEILTSSFLADSDLLLGLYRLPKDAPAELFFSDELLQRNVIRAAMHFETWGIMVYQRYMDLRTVDLMFGGGIRGIWQRIRQFVFAQRENLEDPNYMEWCQWLVERLEENPAPEKSLGVHVALRDWKP